ncbi:MAG: isoleucyl-tRNA synthetase [Actinomycetota bacterium]|nr:isoleucyl-tRNA synthetase [Actinomycetota bacterium]
MSDELYRPVDARVSFPQLEESIEAFWSANNIFFRSLEERKNDPEWVFYEGPPTANNKPGVHHVEARTFKDLFCRFQTMRGHYVHRKAGWDCHGLPVEIEVEKALGIKQKHEIEDRVGIAEFVRQCRESVQRYVDDWSKLTDRIGFWLDLDDAYWTMNPEYVESVWWLLKQIWDKGLLEEDFKVVPYCPRCETSLSSHEQHQPGAYKDVTDPSVYVRFPLEGEERTSLLVWTTTPWTLLANLAAAVGEDIVYAKVPDPQIPGAFLILAKERVEPLLGEGIEPVSEMRGSELIDRRYSPPFDYVPATATSHRVRPGDFVTTDDGSGIVHLAPYGEEDMAVAKRDDLPIVQMVDPRGHVVESAGEPFGGLWVKDADPKIIEDLEKRHLLFRAEDYLHSYPHCWRCGTPLLYYPRKDWYIRTSQVRRELQESNREVQWQPPTIKEGRFGDWLANNVDWSLSRDRYWGTPLPIWRCAENHLVCVGSFAELAERSGRDLTDFDPHRPHVDDITWSCAECGGEMRRVLHVIDAWFDSGAMPFAQWHYPFENEDVFEKRFPANFISEAIDQTRGWFYSLLAISTLIRGTSSYETVVCLGHIVDAEGRKMSKSLGNIIDPWSVLNVQGADALRWYLVTGGTPWSPRRLSPEIIEDSLRKYMLTLWNTYSFWVTYAELERFDPTVDDVPLSERSEMDRWILAELDDTIDEVTTALDGFDATRGGKRLDRFVDDLSNWYVRRSRRRFWRSGEDTDTKAAFLTLWRCLATTAQLTAPFTPFVAEELYTNLTRTNPDAPDSVHLSDWPERIKGASNDALRRRMGLVRRLVGLGRAARTEAKVRVRQPLERALIVMPAADAQDLKGLEDLVAEELNVKRVEAAHGLEDLITYTIKPNFKVLGPRFGKAMPEVARAIEAADPAEIVGAIEQGGSTMVYVEGDQLMLTADDLDIRIEGREGYSLAREGALGVALDLEISEELAAEGLAREVVRAIQDLRKAAGLAVEDRIELWLSTEDEAARTALERHEDYIAGEVLATTVHREPPPGGAATGSVEVEVEVDGATVVCALRKRD